MKIYNFLFRISKVTGLPVELIEESEALQVQHYTRGQFHLTHHDSEPNAKDIPCCMYGDRDRVCRLCRYVVASL